MSEINNFITHFEVSNFKKFDHLVVEDIGQFNLITGDNNVGKTCLLEALLIDYNNDLENNISLLHRVLCNRNVHIHATNTTSKNPIIPENSFFDSLQNVKSRKKIEFLWEINENKKEFKFEAKKLEDLLESDFNKEKNHNFNIDRPLNWIKFFKNKQFSELQFMYLDDFKKTKSKIYIPLIPKNAGFAIDINHLYHENIGLYDSETVSISDVNELSHFAFTSISFEDKNKFIEYLRKLFFNDIQDVMVKPFFGRNILSIKLIRNNDYVPITFFGDGTNECIRYILEIMKFSNNRIMIDEIDTGIHYKKMKDFWKIILQVCKDENVQLFATTHSQECIESYAQAIEELGVEKDGRLMKLDEYLDKNNQTINSSITYNFDDIKFRLNTQTEMRD